MKKLLCVIISFILVFSVCLSAEAGSRNTEEDLDKRVDKIVSKMTLEQKVAQMFIVYMPPSDATKIQKKYQFGGYLLFANSFRNKTPNDKKKQFKGYQKASRINMLICVDEEGGTVNRVSMFKQYRDKPFLSPRQVYKNGGYEAITSDTKEKSTFLLKLGINTNLAPVADTPYNSRDYIYDRCFSTNASKNAKYVKTVVTQMGKSSIVSCMKHFPGYGDSGDTHYSVIHDKRSKKTFKKRDLLPFQAGINAGCDMIMINHDIVDCFDKNNPASLSKAVHKYLREEMGFDGVILTDGLAMPGVVNFLGGNKREAAVKAVIAGNDMLCADDYEVQYDAVLSAVKKGRIKEKKIDKSVKRIIRMKLKRGIIK